MKMYIPVLNETTLPDTPDPQAALPCQVTPLCSALMMMMILKEHIMMMMIMMIMMIYSHHCAMP